MQKAGIKKIIEDHTGGHRIMTSLLTQLKIELTHHISFMVVGRWIKK
jgi:hypothetical protein